jgi:hypothetical protein
MLAFIIKHMAAKRLNLMTANQSNVEAGTIGFSSATVTFEQSSEQHLYDNYSLKITPQGLGSTEDLTIIIPATAGLQYAAKVNLWIPTGHGIVAAYDWTFNGAWRQSVSEVSLSGNNQWQSDVQSGICPETANELRIALRRYSNTDTTPFYYDGGILEQAASIGDYSEYYNLS